MLEFMITILLFSVAFLGFGAALRFSKFEGESNEKCDNETNCILKKLGLSKLHCRS